jgi:hypothetical protein
MSPADSRQLTLNGLDRYRATDFSGVRLVPSRVVRFMATS